MTVTVTLSDGRKLNFSDQFKELSSEQQQQAVASAVGRLQDSPQPSPQIQETSSGLGGAVMSGVRGAAGQLSNLAEAAETTGKIGAFGLRLAQSGGNVEDAVKSFGGRNPFQEQGAVSGALDDFAQSGPQFQPSSTFDDVVADPTRLPGFVAEGLAQALPQAPLALNPATLASMASTTGEEIIKDRVQRSGRAKANFGDIAAAATGSASNVVLSRVGLRAGAAQGLKPTIGQVVRSTVIESGAEGAQAGAEELLRSSDGIDLDRLRNAAGGAAIIGGAAGALRGGQLRQQALSENAAAGNLEVNRLYAARQAGDLLEQRVTQDQAGQGVPGRKEYITAAKGELADQRSFSKDTIESIVEGAKEQFSSTKASAIGKVLNRAENASGKPSLSFDKKLQREVDSLPLEPETKASLNQHFRVVDELSKASIGRNSTRRGAVDKISKGAGLLAAGAAFPVISATIGPSFAYTLSPAVAAGTMKATEAALGPLLRDSAFAKPDIVEPQVRRAQEAVLSRPGVAATRPSSPPVVDPISVVKQKARDQASARRNANRIERINNDPTGANLRANNNLETDNTMAFDQRVSRALNGVALQELKGLGVMPEDIGLNTGPGKFDGSTDGYFSLLPEALARDLMTKEDIRLFRTNPRALMEDNRGNDVVINALQTVFREKVQQRVEAVTTPGQ